MGLGGWPGSLGEEALREWRGQPWGGRGLKARLRARHHSGMCSQWRVLPGTGAWQEDRPGHTRPEQNSGNEGGCGLPRWGRLWDGQCCWGQAGSFRKTHWERVLSGLSLGTSLFSSKSWNRVCFCLCFGYWEAPNQIYDTPLPPSENFIKLVSVYELSFGFIFFIRWSNLLIFLSFVCFPWKLHHIIFGRR